jgi:ribonucleoside-diphosphate reductase beta chain
MRRLDTDRSPQVLLDASIIYNQFVEGVLAIAGYQRWDETFRRLGKLPGLNAGVKLTQRAHREPRRRLRGERTAQRAGA